jgi:peptide/nickel transport system substrate-binding protein
LPALLTHEAQVMGELPPRDAAQAAEQGWAVLPVAVPGQSVQFMLNTTNPPLDDLKVRQALLYATDRAALVRAVFGPESPMAQGPLTAITRSADPALGQLYPFDLARAKVLLAKAGWIDADGDGILDKDGQPLTLDGILMAWGELPAVGTILQAQWRAAGVDLRWEQLPYPAALEAGRNGTHHLIPFVQSGADPGLLAAFFHSRNIGGFNWSRVADPEVDTWLDEAARAADWPEREQRYREVQRRIMEQAWIVPIRDQVNLNAAAPIVKGLTFDVQGWFPVLYDVWLASTGER